MFSLFAVYSNKHNELNYYIFELLNYFISNEFDKINCKSYLPKTRNITHYCKHSSATCFRPYVPFFFSEVYWKSFWNCNIFTFISSYMTQQHSILSSLLHCLTGNQPLANITKNCQVLDPPWLLSYSKLLTSQKGLGQALFPGTRRKNV